MNKKIIIILILLLMIVLLFGCFGPEKKPEIPNYKDNVHNPFGVFYGSGNLGAVKELGAEARVLVFERIDSPKMMKQMDETMKLNEKETYVSLLFETEERMFKLTAVGNNKYCLSEGEDRERSKAFAKKIVERYDGDNDFGCTIINEKDCYENGDALYPSEELQNAILENPIHYWQIDNEFVYQIRDCSNGKEEEIQVPKEKMVDYIKEMGAFIKEVDSEAKIITPSFTEFARVLLLDRRVDYVEWGRDDCVRTTLTYEDAIEQLNSGSEDALRVKKEIEEAKEYFEYILTESKDYYDVIDFHDYGNNYYMSEAFAGWMNALGLGEKDLVSTELGGPFYFYEAIGAPQPTECARSGKDDRGPDRYSEAVLSEYVVKNFVIAFNAGIDRVHWATLTELFDPYQDNFKRASLLNTDNSKKPAFYTYKLMRQKLDGFVSVREIEDDVYKFVLDDERVVMVAWSGGGDKTIDLSEHFASENIEVIHIVTELDSNKEPIYPEDEIVPKGKVLISEIPIFIEEK